MLSGIVMTVTPMGLVATGCNLNNERQCGGGGGGPVPDPVTVAYTPVVCTTPEAGALPDAPDGDVTAEAGDGSAPDDGSSPGDAGSDASSGPPVCNDDRMCERLCPAGYNRCARELNDAGVDSVTCSVGPTASCGRRFAGLRQRAHRGATPLGAFFAGSAYLEEASITSFEILAEELSAHGAPDSLIVDAKRSARDEVRHARVMTALAKRHRGKVATVHARRHVVRPLAKVVRENAIEGCVRETYGALVATFQATHAGCPKIRAVMSRIARDETRHATLAWKIDAWASATPSTDQRAVTRARERAVKKLRRELASPTHPSLVKEAGMPTAQQAVALLDELTSALGLLTAP